MPRTKPASPRKRGKKTTTSKSPRAPSAALTPLQQDFADKLRLCTAMERKFVAFKLKRKNGKEAAILAGYAAKNADSQAAHLSGRLRVSEAIEAGLRAAGFGPLELLDDIEALRTFDRSQVEREIKVPVVMHVMRPAEEVVQELITRERAVSNFIDTYKEGSVQDEAQLKKFQHRLSELLLQRLELEEQLAVNPNATTLVEVTELVTKRVIDYDLARERGLLRFFKKETPGKYGDVIELHDWVTGLEMAAKTQGLYKERHELTGKDGGAIELAGIEALTGTALMDRYKALLEVDDT